jgi:hypothetical protein
MGSGERDRSDAVSEESAAERSPTPDTDESRVDGALEIEQELADVPGTDADLGEEEATGQVTEVQKLSADSVPETYPIAIESNEAVGFRVRLTVDREAMVYLAWPDTYDESADLACLLNDLGIAPDRFADIIGKEINLVVVDGQWVPEVAAESARPHPAAGSAAEMPTIPEPDPTSEQAEVVLNDGTAAVVRDATGTRVVNANRVDEELSVARETKRKRTVNPVVKDDPETSPKYYFGVLGIGGLWTAVLFGLFTGLHVVPTSVTALLLLASPVAFPFLIYRDAEHVSANSEWSPHIAWTIASVFWALNTFVFLAYVYQRWQAMPGDQFIPRD